MAYGFFRPTKYKLVAFILISVLLYFIPVVPTTSTATDAWNVMSVSHINRAIEIEGVTTHSFGVFSGTLADMMNILYILMFGYILACLILYGFHKIHG